MKVFLHLIITLLYNILCKAEPSEEKGILILTNETFGQVIENNRYILTAFYSPNCPHCKKFIPEFEKASTPLKNKDIKLGKVNVNIENKLAQEYRIRALPTVFLFIKGQPLEYRGSNDESSLINFINKKLENPCKKLNTSEEIKKFQKDNKVCVIYFGSKINEKEDFFDVSRMIEKVPFAIVEDIELIKNYAKEINKVFLFKQFDEKMNELNNNLTFNNIENFVLNNYYQKVLSFDSDTYTKVIVDENPALYLFSDNSSSTWKKYAEIIKNVSKQINGGILVIHTDIKEGLAAGVAKYLGVKESELPLVRIEDNNIHYELENEINVDNIYKFYQDWTNGKLEPKLNSEPIPKENNGDVFILVGKNYRKEVIENNMDVFVFLYTPWCENCKELKENFAQLAKKLKKNNKQLRLAQIDYSKNEVKELKHLNLIFPGYKLYSAKNKDKVPLDYDGEKTFDALIQYLKKNCDNKIEYEEEKDKKEKNNKEKDNEKTIEL